MEKSNIPEILKGKTYLDPTYDPAFKALFDNEDALISFLNSVLHLENEKLITSLEYRKNDSLDLRLPESKTFVYDIRATTAQGHVLDIEMQRAKHPGIIDRMFLYNASLILKGKLEMDAQSKLQKNIFANRNRYTIPNTISIWICNFELNERKEYRDVWQVYSENAILSGEYNPISTKNSYIIIELPKFQKELKDLTSIEDYWLYLLKNAGNQNEISQVKDKVIQESLERIRINYINNELLQKQVTDMVTQDEIDCRLADAEITGLERGMAKGMAKGMEKGLAKGLEKGLEKGMTKKAREMAKAMLLKSLPIAMIAEISGLSESEIKSL